MTLLTAVSTTSMIGFADQHASLRGEEAARETTLAEFYWSWFDARVTHTDDLRDAAFRLRYRVYCIENPFEDPSANPDGREIDAYDKHAAHSLLIYRPTNTPAGTVRLVLPLSHDPDNSFALHHVCSHPLLRDRARFPIQAMAEVSRFCISKEFRRRLGDGSSVVGDVSDGMEMSADDERRILPHLSLGLIETLVRMSIENGVTHWCAVMEPTLLRLLTRLGIHFDPIDAPDAVAFPDGPGIITFENVDFAYAPDLPVLSQLSLDVPAGKVTALVGAAQKNPPVGVATVILSHNLVSQLAAQMVIKQGINGPAALVPTGILAGITYLSQVAGGVR
jgi:N-acyl amino acid synthase of PEP-CTERM/exosortase system